MNIKTIAMYLPQFHKIPENDMWWGEGFTEWTAVKKAINYVGGQMQPKIPLNQNYYDLMDKSVMEWQAKLVEKYDIYGLCFYHYWFENGRKVLEKPAENLLKWKDINMRFCFSWANESWARTWSKLASKNVWSESYESAEENQQISDGILLRQKYGGESDWRQHYEYLRPFWRDERYICIDGKPVFVICKTDDIECINEMIECWNQWCMQDGFAGIYIIATNPQRVNTHFDAVLFQEPARTIGAAWLEDVQKSECNGIRMFDYDAVWRKILSRNSGKDIKEYYGGFVDYDDTPRRGKRGQIFTGVSVRKFGQYFEQLVQKNIKAGNEFVFLNAWNEWGEGMYLEPDEVNRYGYLEEICRAVNLEKAFPEEGIPQRISPKILDEYELKLEKLSKRYLKFKEYFDILNKWMVIREKGRNLESYFKEHRLYRIAIYGMGVMGKHLLSDLSGSSVCVVYGIDKYADNIHVGIPMKNIDESFEDIDAVVVTATFEFEEIRDIIKQQCACPVISLRKIVEECE